MIGLQWKGWHRKSDKEKKTRCHMCSVLPECISPSAWRLWTPWFWRSFGQAPSVASIPRQNLHAPAASWPSGLSRLSGSEETHQSKGVGKQVLLCQVTSHYIGCVKYGTSVKFWGSQAGNQGRACVFICVCVCVWTNPLLAAAQHQEGFNVVLLHVSIPLSSKSRLHIVVFVQIL